MEKGKLILIPTPIGNSTQFPLLCFSSEILFSLKVFIVEELTTARRFLRKAAYSTPFEQVTFLVLNEQSKPEESIDFLSFINNGLSVGLMSEAGLPCIADPGARAVKIAHQHQIEVVPLPGPSSLFLTLMASGANGQRFVFHGYLPIDKNARTKKIQELERKARLDGESQIFIETPYRNEQLLEAILRVCKEDTLICIGCDLLSENQFIATKTTREWKSNTHSSLHKRPAVFIIFY